MNEKKALSGFEVADVIEWRLEGPFDSSYSLALLNRELARGLSECGAVVSLHSTEGPGDFLPSKDFLNANSDISVFYERSLNQVQSEVNVCSRNLYPPRVEDMSATMNLLHSYAWEESGFPHEWVNNFNTHLSALTCLSHHVEKVMIDNGVSLPMAVTGCGVDHWERIEANKTFNSGLETGDKRFKFLHVSSCFPRKGPDALLGAYGQAFSRADDVLLVIKTFPNPHNTIHDQLREVRSDFPDYPAVLILEDDLADTDLKALYEACDVLVAPSCAEGFALPLAEAMLSGIPVISTNWSGQLDFCSEDNAWLVDYHFAQADTHFELLPSAWAEVDTLALAQAMREAYSTPLADREAMACSGRELLLNQFKWKDVAERLLAFYQEQKDLQQEINPQVGWITTWNTKCGIATYSRHLLESMGLDVTILAPYASDTLSDDGENCVRCWQIGDSDSLSVLEEIIEQRKLNTIVIQFNFGFFEQDRLEAFIACQKAAGRVVVVDMHATQDPPQDPSKQLALYARGLDLADRLLMHTIADMNRLKSYGLEKRLALFPHGILDCPVSNTMANEIPVLATYGFCLPHKGLLEVVEAVALLHSSGYPVRLNMVNAEYPVDFSAALACELRDRIKQLSMQDFITLESRFLEDEESLKLLQQSDLVLFVYHPTSESASGAVRYGVAAGKPVLVTDLPIFAEFGDGVWKVSDNHPETMATQIRKVLEAKYAGKKDYFEKLDAATRWREQHFYSRLSRRLGGMLKGLLVNTDRYLSS